MGEDNHEVDKYLLLFHPVEQYLIYFSTPDETVSFTEMEALAEELEVIKTGFRYSLEKSATNWSIADYGAGWIKMKGTTCKRELYRLYCF